MNLGSFTNVDYPVDERGIICEERFDGQRGIVYSVETSLVVRFIFSLENQGKSRKGTMEAREIMY